MAPTTTPWASPFYNKGNDWFVDTYLPSDIVVEIRGTSFHLHKFPLLSKCGKIAHALEESENTDKEVHLRLDCCPGGLDAFIIAAKFCYGFRVELSPANILVVYCVAEFLEMTVEFGEENLLAQAEAFFHKVVLRSWKDCIVALQSADNSISHAESLRIVHKCLSALSMMVCTDPSLFGWPMMMYGSLQSPGGSILWNGINTGARIRSLVSDWWLEDISCLSLLMFKRLIETMTERGIRPENISVALMHYLRKYLPGLDRWQIGLGGRSKNLANLAMATGIIDQKVLLECLEKLFPERKGKSYSRFLLGLLRIAIILNVCQSCKDSLERRIGMQLELATLDGLLIPNFSYSDNLYDTDCVERIIGHFLSYQSVTVVSFSPSSSDPPRSPSSTPIRKVTKLIDSYLSEIAPDVNLKPDKMLSLVETLPESFRSLHDGLYRALDIYFKAHPWLSQVEREQLCNSIDYGRLSIDACAHVSQNERLPLRVVLQVLYFEQLHLRKALSQCLHVLDSDSNATADANDLPGQILQRDGWVTLVRENCGLRVDLEGMQSRVRVLEQEFASMKQDLGKADRPQSLSITAQAISRKLGCMPVTNSSSLHCDAVESFGSMPGRSIKKAHHSNH
ncbi:putative SKP1/BTB/POZ domain superfamily, NPH3 domain, NPH3/RPT2-like family protein [Dioscorea sansibarensis]